MKLLFCLAIVVAVVATAFPDLLNQEEGKCGCCPLPCCCKCVTTAQKEGKTCPPPVSTTTFIPECNSTLDISVILDSSGSISTDWPLALQFVRDILSAFPVIGIEGTRMAMVRYSTNATLDWDFCGDETNNGQQRLMDALMPSNLELLNGLTNAAEGLEVAVEQILTPEGCDRPDTENVAIFISDGRSNFRLSDIEGLAVRLHSKVKCVIAVGITDAISMEELQIISNCNGEDVILTVNDFTELSKLLVRLVTEVCTDPVETTPPPPCVPEESTFEEKCFCCCPPPSGYNGFHMKSSCDQ